MSKPEFARRSFVMDVIILDSAAPGGDVVTIEAGKEPDSVWGWQFRDQ